MSRTKFPIWAALLAAGCTTERLPSAERARYQSNRLFPPQPEFYLYKGIAASQLKKNDEAVEALVTGRDLVVDNKPLEGNFWSSLG
ncbi:MAG: hypothetical protein IPP33_09750 [Flavobacteriales bacterium]|nr:hypothetical protein [Flavobacteriales bacterium]